MPVVADPGAPPDVTRPTPVSPPPPAPGPLGSRTNPLPPPGLGADPLTDPASLSTVGGGDFATAERAANQGLSPAEGAVTLLPPRIVQARMSELYMANPWMPPDMILAVAKSPGSDAQMLQVAKALTAAAKTLGNGLNLVHQDPVLQKNPTPLLTLQRFITSAVGPWPLEDQNLRDIQHGIQAAGFAQGLPVDGVWDAGWNAAYDQWSYALLTNQLGGNTLGAKPAGGVLHALTSFLPHEAGNAIAGFIGGLGHVGRQAVADVGGAAVGLGSAAVATASHLITRGEIGNVGGVGSAAARNQQGFAHAVAPWDPTYASQQALEADLTPRAALGKGIAAGTTVAGIGDVVKGMLALHAAMTAGSDVALANGLRGLGVNAKALFTTTGAREAAAKELGLADALRGPGVIANSVGQGLKVAATKAFGNIPVLSRVGPWIGDLADADGLYYRTRTLLATPSAFLPVRVAGVAMGQAGLIGTRLRAGAAASKITAGQPTALSQAVENSRALDGIDAAMRNRLQFTAFGHHVQLGLDTLPFLLHIPTSAALEPSSTVGREVTGYTNAITHAMGPSTSLAAQIERGTGADLNDLIKGLGGTERFGRYWTYKVYQHAAAHYAETELARLPDELKGESEQDDLNFLRAKEGEALSELGETDTPTILTAAIAEMLGNDQGLVTYQLGGSNELSKRIARELGLVRRAPKAVIRDANAYLDASDHFERAVLPNQDKLILPGTGEPPGGQVASLGLMRKDNLDAAQAMAQLARFRTRLEDPALTIGKANKIESDLREFLFREFGMDAKKIPGTPADALDKAEDYARHNMAGPVTLAADAPPMLADAVSAINALGYKLVHGTDIGWRHVPQAPLDVLSAPRTRLRKLIEAIGLNPEAHPTADVSFWKYQGMRNAIQRLIDRGQITLPPYHTADSLLAHLWDGDAIDLSPDIVTRGVYNTVGRAARHGQVQDAIPIIQASGRAAAAGDARKVAVGDMENDLSRSLGLENIPRRSVVKALTSPDSVPKALAAEYDHLESTEGVRPQFMTTKDANKVYRAIVQGAASPPAYLLGLSKLDALARTGFGSMGFLGDAVPGKVGDMLANLPNELMTLRNRFRFQLSPEFSFRRITKANAKLWMDGVPGTIFPMRAMKTAGTYAEDLKTLDRVMPELQNKQFDQINEALYSNDAFGFYSHRNWEAYAAGHWARQGKTDAQIRDLLIKDFGYGSKARGEGRSALERTVNTIFFPFSFDKTLYRNVGGYLLDHPARMMMLTAGLNAYNAFNQAHEAGNIPGSASWFQKYLPVAQEALRLNAFAHGVSLGQFGGINAPLLNLFMPQAFNSSKHTAATIGSLIPAYTELKGLWKEAVQQGQIFDQYARDELARYTQKGYTPADWVPAESSNFQLSDAYALRRQIMASVEPYISYNNLHSTGQYTVPKEARFGKYQGDVINAALVDRMVHDQFPDYDPNQAVAFSDIQKQQLATWVDNLTGRYAGQIRSWVDNAQTIGKAIYEGKYDAADAQMWTDKVRQDAIWLGERDPAFYQMYNGTYGFRWEFGPLEKVKG